MDVPHLYVPKRRTKRTNYGLSELQVKAKLLKEGWEVWRGGNIGITRRAELYPNVERKYRRLCELLEQDYPKQLELLQYLCHVHHGMPDYVCYRRGEWKFVECKLYHEQLSKRQKTCITKLQSLGFIVEVHKLIDHRTKTRKAEINLATGKKKIKEHQLTLNSKRIKEATKQLKKHSKARAEL
jgi:hypothetical protein